MQIHRFRPIHNYHVCDATNEMPFAITLIAYNVSTIVDIYSHMLYDSNAIIRV